VGETIASIALICCSLNATVTLTKCIQDEFHAAGYSQLLKDPVDVVPYGMFLYFELLSNFTVLQAVRDEMDDFFLAMGQQGHLIGFVKMRRQDMS
jgi:hypothetical protein